MLNIQGENIGDGNMSNQNINNQMLIQPQMKINFVNQQNQAQNQQRPQQRYSGEKGKAKPFTGGQPSGSFDYNSLTPAQIARKQALENDEEMLNAAIQNQNHVVLPKMEKLQEEINTLNSKLAGIRFKIDRKMIKQGAREERRQSIHKLELEKNLQFHPKRDRSKSIPTINMNLRLQALKDMKEDLLMRRCKISDEIDDQELEINVRSMEYNFNNINR